MDRVQIFFPDPWPKRKHQKRRLIQENFIKLIHEKLKEGGFFHIKTDWKDYAWSISKTMKTVEGFKAMSESYENLNYPKTKFEKRGMRLAHQVYELIFIKS